MSDLSDDDRNNVRNVADPLIGIVVADRYRILSLLGVGGMGVVYKVEHVHIGKLMAMKLLAGSLSRDATVIRRFRREALAASRLSHPNTVQVFDFGQANNLTYLVMELVNGEDLSLVLKRSGPLPAVRLAKLMVQICSSLKEAHAAGIIHRDLKPENVLLVSSKDIKDELPKVCDFGVAKLRSAPDGSNDATNQNTVVGTPYYMAPEQIRGEDVDPRADIYALGAMMYRLLTDAPPFDGPTPMVVFAKHLTENPQPPSIAFPSLNIPQTLDAIILKAMSKRPEDRFADVGVLQQSLIEFLRGGNTSSIDILVDSGQLRALASLVASTTNSDSHPGIVLPRKAATRDEVAAYERKLAIQKYTGQAILGLGLVGLIGALWFGYQKARAYVDALTHPPPPPEGLEQEPNDEAARANVLLWGKEIRGQLGRRSSPERGDRDFYACDVPAGSSFASLQLTALPNFPTCLWLYHGGFREPIARFCPGDLRQDLLLPVYRVEPGRYLLAVLQDMDPRGAESPIPVYENVSDFYRLSFQPTSANAEVEIEPNDTPQTATHVAPDVEIKGVLNFVNDADVFCPDTSLAKGSIRWTIRDSVSLPRPNGTALEIKQDRGGVGGSARYVLHRTGSLGKVDSTHVLSPFSTPTIKLDGSPFTGCISLRLLRDPWSDVRKEPLPSNEPYSIKLERGS